jgi:hypothetical protein
MASPDNTERQAVIGQVMEASARMEAALEGCIRACLAMPRPEMLAPLLQKQTFRQQVEILEHTAALLFERLHPTYIAFRRWLRRLERLRRRRNALVHVLLRRDANLADVGQLRAEVLRLEEECEAADGWTSLLTARIEEDRTLTS